MCIWCFCVSTYPIHFLSKLWVILCELTLFSHELLFNKKLQAGNYGELQRVPRAFGWTELVGLGIIEPGGQVIRNLELYGEYHFFVSFGLFIGFIDRTSNPLSRLVQDLFIVSCVIFTGICYFYSDSKLKEEKILGSIALTCLAWWLLNVISIKLNGMLAIPVLIGEPVDAVDVQTHGGNFANFWRPICSPFSLYFTS